MIVWASSRNSTMAVSLTKSEPLIARKASRALSASLRISSRTASGVDKVKKSSMASKRSLKRSGGAYSCVAITSHTSAVVYSQWVRKLPVIAHLERHGAGETGRSHRDADGLRPVAPLNLGFQRPAEQTWLGIQGVEEELGDFLIFPDSGSLGRHRVLGLKGEVSGREAQTQDTLQNSALGQLESLQCCPYNTWELGGWQ